VPAYPLSENTYTVDSSKVFIPFQRGIDDIRNRPGSLLVDIVPFLVQTKEYNIVIDPGLGLKLSNGHYHILDNLMRHQLSASDIDIILLSHLHKDHLAGAVMEIADAMSPMFPNAIYYVQEGELNDALSKSSSSYDRKVIDYLLQEGLLRTINGNTTLKDCIQCEISGGHTPYHQIFIIDDGNANFFYGGDVLPQPQQLIRRFVAKYDYDGKHSADKRIEYGKRIAEGDLTALYFHSALQPMSKVSYDGDKFMVI
jgi:glyoxylase-like metal-dependent hydrolase (beta-lactamase superfamily II)